MCHDHRSVFEDGNRNKSSAQNVLAKTVYKYPVIETVGSNWRKGEGVTGGGADDNT